jgi:hypothetical protein
VWAALATPVSATAGEWVDTRLVFIAGDDDLMHDAGSTVPPSQLPDFGDRPGYTEPYDARDETETGRESRTHLVLHAGADGYFEGLRTEAALVVELNHARLTAGDPRALADDGTYLRVLQKTAAGELEVLLMPFDSDRMRLGFLWDLTWGGNTVFPSASVVPAAKVAWNSPLWGVYAGLKTARMQFVTRDTDDRNGQIEAFYGGFGGLRVGPEDGLRLDVNGGFFQKGRNPNGPVRGEPVDSGGVSGRIAYVNGLPFVPTNDTRLYSADPIRPWNTVVAPGAGLVWRVAAEATWVTQVLEDPDLAGGTIDEAGLAAALHGRMRFGHNRIHALGLLRELPFLFFSSPGANTRFQALPAVLDPQPEVVFVAGYERHFPSAHLTPGFTFGVQQPAHIESVVPKSGNFPPDVLQGPRTVVYRRADMFDDTGLLTGYFLEEGQEVVPVIGGRAHLQLDLAEGFAAQAQITFIHDDNRVRLDQDVLGVNSVRTFSDPFSLGVAVMLRAEM